MPNIFEETAAKAAGKLGAMKSAVNGLDGVFRQLAEEHKAVATLLPSATLTSDPEKRADMWARIRQDLTAHEHAELEIVYPEFEMHASLADIVSQHEAEADELEELIRNVDTAPLESMQWETCMKELQAAVLRHVAREETDFFPRAQAVIGERRAEELEGIYMAARQTLTRGL